IWAWLAVLPSSLTLQWSLEARFSIAFTLLLLFCWTCLFVWRSHLSRWLLTGPYLFLACALAFAYAYSSPTSTYTLVLIGIALLYHCIERFAQKSIQRVETLRGQIEFLIVASLCVLPFIVDALLPLKVFTQTYGFSSMSTILTPVRDPMVILIDLVALGCGIA